MTHWRAGTAKNAKGSEGCREGRNRGQEGSGKGGAGREVTRTRTTWPAQETLPPVCMLQVASAVSSPGNVISKSPQ